MVPAFGLEPFEGDFHLQVGSFSAPSHTPAGTAGTGKPAFKFSIDSEAAGRSSGSQGRLRASLRLQAPLKIRSRFHPAGVDFAGTFGPGSLGRREDPPRAAVIKATATDHRSLRPGGDRDGPGPPGPGPAGRGPGKT